MRLPLSLTFVFPAVGETLQSIHRSSASRCTNLLTCIICASILQSLPRELGGLRHWQSFCRVSAVSLWR